MGFEIEVYKSIVHTRMEEMKKVSNENKRLAEMKQSNQKKMATKSTKRSSFFRSRKAG
ncbi:hypothetical protein ACFSTA_02670 [Ornithinibacillus salinisoli]|uniref:Uncharacterized protein n=1 Tax=Ornithinibacillus salinisoli TaxID=1848459 RepID=A0ABW4VVT4_9BACI